MRPEATLLAPYRGKTHGKDKKGSCYLSRHSITAHIEEVGIQVTEHVRTQMMALNVCMKACDSTRNHDITTARTETT